MDSEKADGRLFTRLFNQLDVHDQITVLRYMDDLDQERQAREAAIIDIRDFQSQRKEK